MYKHSIKQKASQQPSAAPLHSAGLSRDSPLEEAVYYCHRHMHIPPAQLNVILECSEPSLKIFFFLLKGEHKCRILIFVAHQLVKSSGERHRIMVPTSNPVLYIFTLENFFIKRSEMARSSGPMNSVGFDYV